jgi:hypothetical protein
LPCVSLFSALDDAREVTYWWIIAYNRECGASAFSLRLLESEVTQRRFKEILERIDVGRTYEDILAVFHATESIKSGAVDNNARVPSGHLGRTVPSAFI